MSKRQLRDLLLRRRADLAARLAQLRAGLSTLSGDQSRGFSELAQECETDEVSRQQGSLYEDEIRQYDEALARLDAGVYGLCAQCGEVIEEQRLRAVPMTTLCMTCAAHAAPPTAR